MNCIKRNVTYARERNFNIQFVWIPSHVDIRKHDHVDKLAKEACRKHCKYRYRDAIIIEHTTEHFYVNTKAKVDQR